MLRRTRGAKLGLRRCSNLPGLALFKHRSRLIIRDGDWRLEVGTETDPWTVDPTTRGGSGQRASGSHGGSRPQLARIFQRHQRAPDISGAGSPARPPGPTPSRRGPPRAAACATAHPCSTTGDPRPAIPDPNSTQHGVALGLLLLPHPFPLAAGEPSRRNRPFPVRPLLQPPSRDLPINSFKISGASAQKFFILFVFQKQ